MLPSIGSIAARRRWLYGELVKFAGCSNTSCRLAVCAGRPRNMPAATKPFIGTKSKTLDASASAHGRLKLAGEARIMGAAPAREAPLSEAEPIQLSPRSGAGLNSSAAFAHSAIPSTVFFTRKEFTAILDLYGRKVAAGEWRDYAIDFGREKAVFSVFRRVERGPPLSHREEPAAGAPARRLQRHRRHRPHPQARPRPGPRAGRPGEEHPPRRGLTRYLSLFA